MQHNHSRIRVEWLSPRIASIANSKVAWISWDGLAFLGQGALAFQQPLANARVDTGTLAFQRGGPRQGLGRNGCLTLDASAGVLVLTDIIEKIKEIKLILPLPGGGSIMDLYNVAASLSDGDQGQVVSCFLMTLKYVQDLDLDGAE